MPARPTDPFRGGSDVVGSSVPDRCGDRAGRVPRSPRAVVVAAVLAMALVAGSATGCASGGGDGPSVVPLATLTGHESRYAGHEVTTTGTVRSWGHGSAAQFWIEDDQQHRVGLEPGSRVADRVGDEVTVTGRFDFDESSGRVIRVADVHAPT